MDGPIILLALGLGRADWDRERRCDAMGRGFPGWDVDQGLRVRKIYLSRCDLSPWTCSVYTNRSSSVRQSKGSTVRLLCLSLLDRLPRDTRLCGDVLSSSW
ncbi:uncharacterized protein BP01DRAFT_133052 [Aspergillus saccharolyticus JOP 1030-1]|uniref:Uncharacterized protein n=1 Tax=Aspergillus saccharolyticus JOP 1030-1 TaxID=1450539 RepID=A0A318Z595_9EURO|nr:hypothetical protein BP01DRAFT_133052 [Aspergillus saccharolyticus JOP 1030-1]PYH42481.1 hypothetical protein BP01DRAFT_133052 [Aspergillus saccharolyticus JOP 1030-1]